MKTWEDLYGKVDEDGFPYPKRPKEEYYKYFHPSESTSKKGPESGGKEWRVPLRQSASVDVVRFLDWSCDGKMLAGGTTEGYLVVLDIQKSIDGMNAKPERLPTPIFEHQVSPNSKRYGIEWHPEDPSIIATVSDELKIWDVSRRIEESCILSVSIKNPEGKPCGTGLRVRWSPAGTYLVICTSNDTLCVYSAAKLEQISCNAFPYIVNEFRITPSGKSLLVCTAGGFVDIFAFGSKPTVHPQVKQAVVSCNPSATLSSIDVDPQGRFFACSSSDRVVHFITSDSFEPMGCFSRCKDKICSISLNYDGEMACVASERELFIVHCRSKQVLCLIISLSFYM